MNPFLREKSDGRKSAGYLVYLAVGAGAAAGLYLLHSRTAETSPSPGRRAQAPASNVAPITQSAAILSPVEVAGKAGGDETPSYRLRGQGADSDVGRPDITIRALTPSQFDPIGETLAVSSAAAAASPYAELAPAFPSNQVRGQATDVDVGRPDINIRGLTPSARSELTSGNLTPSTPSGQLLGYRDPSADVSQLSEVGGRVPAAPALSTEYISPRGTLICVYLLTTVDTGNPAAVIQFAAARNVFFNRRCQIPFGTRFLGRLSGSPFRDRLNLTADTILYPDGLELPVNASAVEADETGGNIWPGVAAFYFPPPLWVQTAPYVSDFFTGAMGLLESRAQQQFAIGVGGVSVQATGEGALRAPLYQASSQAVQDFTQAQLKEVEQRYASHYVIPAGTACWLQLDADLNVAAAHGGGHR